MNPRHTNPGLPLKAAIWFVITALFAAPLSFADGLRPVHAKRTMVVSVHQEASRVGAEIMRQGGNAVDAAVATGFALAVVHPAAGTIGGGALMMS